MKYENFKNEVYLVRKCQRCATWIVALNLRQAILASLATSGLILITWLTCYKHHFSSHYVRVRV